MRDGALVDAGGGYFPMSHLDMEVPRGQRAKHAESVRLSLPLVFYLSIFLFIYWEMHQYMSVVTHFSVQAVSF